MNYENEIKPKLDEAINIFKNYNIYHGVALISFIKATFIYEKYKDT